MFFNNISLAKKLSIGFGAVLLVVAASSSFAVYKTIETKEIERLNSISDGAIDNLDLNKGDLESIRSAVRKLIMTGAQADDAKLQASAAEQVKDLAAAKDILAKDAPRFLSDLADYQAKVDAYLKEGIFAEEKLSLDPATRLQAAGVMEATAPLAAAADASFRTLRSKVNAWSDEETAAGNAAMDTMELVAIVSGVVSLLIGVAMAWLIIRAIGRPVSSMTEAMRRLAGDDNTVAIPAVGQKDEIGAMAAAVQTFKDAAIEKVKLEGEAAEARQTAEADRARNEAERAAAAEQQAAVVDGIASGLEHLADGNLVFRLQAAFAPEYEKLRADFNGAVDKLQDAMTVVASNTAAIRSGSTEISSAADDLSKRTEQQAASLEETAAALDEITATVKKTSDGASHARQVVSTAKTDAERSGQVVGQAVQAMTAIEQSSKQVSQIIGVIDEIAFQTNLLALNAGVEAARAGETGRGFAVVASEVRALAQRSAEAAKEIKALISTSTGQVSEGVSLVAETGKSLERIVGQVGEINAIVSDIATSAQEQAAGLEQVNTAVNHMDQVTQQNAAMVEESTAASHSLAQEAEELARLIGRFQLGRDTTAERAGPTRAVGKSARAAVATLKPTGRGGAARKPEAQPEEAGWEDF